MRPQSGTRKRGDKLIESIYAATVEIIKQEGYAGLSFLKIARVAHTGRTVLYRRWATPFELVREIVSFKSNEALGGDLIDVIKDTGSLRGDLLYILGLYQKIYANVGPEIMNAVLFEVSQNSFRIPTIKSEIDLKNIQVAEKILAFAKKRGEAIKDLSEAALSLPFDLIRIHFILDQQVFSAAEQEQLVDDILLPVFTGLSS